MNTAKDWVGLMRVCGAAKFENEKKAVEAVERTYYSILEEVEKHMQCCPKCGTKLEGRIRPFLPEHKYCGKCMMYAINFMAGNIGLPDKFIV